jgi:hypothetical protein
MHKSVPVSITMCVLGRIDTETANIAIGTDLTNVPKHPGNETARAIMRAGATRQREIFYPRSQGLGVVTLLRPFIPEVFDQVFLNFAQ